jgi:GT2 family glycosyltransferase
MKPPKISVVVPSFNKVNYIGETLDSIFSQRYSNLEVIIQDGGSNDGTLEIIKEFAKKYPKEIRWESIKDNGQLDAISKGLRKATGEILTFINADDAYTDKAFSVVAKVYIQNSDSFWFAGKGKVIDKNGHEIIRNATSYKNFLLSLNSRLCFLIVNYLMQPSVFISHEAYEKYGPFTGSDKFVMEYDFWLKLSKVKMPVIVNEYLSKFRIERSTKTKQMSRAMLSEDLKIIYRYTKNPIIIFLHKLNNVGRLVVNKFV